MLFDAPEVGDLRVSRWVVAATVGATAGLVLFVLGAAVRALARRPTMGAASVVGQTGVAREGLAPEGQVTLQGEIWRAVAADGPVDAGARVRVVGVEGLTLRVVKAGEEGGAS
jgi:membrane-bound serine protease (ClpP class)